MQFPKKKEFSRIYLVGMPASGKSTLGRLLALKTNSQFVDIDCEIEKKTGLGIPDIFATYGEDSFREIERETLQETLPHPAVIATGGGAPCFFDNMAFINANGVSVFLKVPVDILAKRAAVQAGTRPLLNSHTDLAATLENTFKKRLAFYEQADIIINGEEQANPTKTLQLLAVFRKVSQAAFAL